MDNVMEFVRGDGADHEFSIQADAWTPGGRLFFAAKPAFDDDVTDANALIQGSWGDADSVIFDEIIDGIAYKTYRCHFSGSATNSIASNGAATAEYLGEFQFVPATGDPITFPARDDKLDTILYFDIKRKTSV